MRQILLIARREWTAVMLSPIGLAILAFYLILSGYVFSSNVSMTQEATLRYTLSTLGLFTIYITPLITMRLLAEELRSGTFEILVSNPVTDSQIILGKFLAGWFSFILMSLPTVSYLFILQLLGSPDWGPAIAGYFGQQCLAAMLIALGLMLSAATQNQVLAAMGAMVGGSLFVLVRNAPSIFGGVLGNALSYLAVLEHYSHFRRGILDTRTLAFFLLSTLMFLFIAVRVVESRRWKFGVTPGVVPTQWNYPKLSVISLVLAFLFFVESFLSWFSRGLWGTYNTTVFILAIVWIGLPAWQNYSRLKYELGRRQTGIALTVITNCFLVIAIWGMLVYLTSHYFVRFDLTASRHYSLSGQTLSVLSKLNTPVQIVTAINQPTDLVQEIHDLVDEYKAHTKSITVSYIDPIRSPGEMDRLRRQYKLNSPLSDELLVAIGDRSRRIPKSALFYQTVQVANGLRIRGPMQFVGEAEITSAIILLSRNTPGNVVFLAGHGERNPEDNGNEGISRAIAELSRTGWKVQSQAAAPRTESKFSSDTHVVVVAGPRKRLADEDLKALNDVLDRGGGVLALVDPGADTGLDPLLNAWNIRLANDLVMDFQDFISSGDPTSLFVTRFAANHPLGVGMGSLAVVLPTARRVAMQLTNPNPNMNTHNFMLTSGNSWAVKYEPDQKPKVDPKTDHKGPISVGVAVERYQEFSEPGRNPLQGRMTVIGDSDFLTNQYIDMGGNLDLFLNSIDWLAGRHDLISVRPKITEMRFMPITTAQMKWVYWWSVVLIPGAAFTASLSAMVRRRTKA